ncbi:MAG: hypothetical protein H7Y41_04695 [Hyphomonadaceae bacterium]|nr:hypothetical protein [Clostridia bacterium]
MIYHSTPGQNQCTLYENVSLKALLEQSGTLAIHAPMNEKYSGFSECRMWML